MAKLKFNPPGYQDLGAYALLKNIVENGNLISEGGAGYDGYVAVISQTGTNAPSPIVLNNSLGVDVTYVYDSPGVYYGIMDKSIFQSPFEYTVIGGELPGYTFTVCPVFYNVFEIKTYDTGILTDGLLSNSLPNNLVPALLEIRKYN